MRPLAWLSFLVSTALLFYTIYLVSPLLSLALEDTSRDAIPESELIASNTSRPQSRPELIPKIIHQTYKNESIPIKWQKAQKACIDLHPDYEYKLWTDATARDFIATEYRWFLSTYDNYRHPIQRTDAFRYFVLLHYGGVYIDLDIGCKCRLDPLLVYNAFVRETVPTGISNDVMGAEPNHPFFHRVTQSLTKANRNWISPYVTIMASTGPLFLSVVWTKWVQQHYDYNLDDWAGRVRIIVPDHDDLHLWRFFQDYEGSSWHGKDAQFMYWMSQNWLMVTTSGFMITGILAAVIWRAYHFWSIRRSRRMARNGGVVHVVRNSRPILPLWRQIGRQLIGGGEDASKQNYTYELVETRDA